MATEPRDIDLSGMRDPQKPVALTVGVVLIVVGVVSLTGVIDGNIIGEGLVLGLFAIPFWLGITAVVAGLLGIALSFYAGGGTTFDKVAAGLVLPTVLFLAVVDWTLAVGSLPYLVVGLIALLLAVALVAVSVVLFHGHSLAFVLPVVAALAVVDWTFSLTATTPNDPVNLPTLGLLLAIALVVGIIGFEGGRRLT